MVELVGCCLSAAVAHGASKASACRGRWDWGRGWPPGVGERSSCCCNALRPDFVQRVQLRNREPQLRLRNKDNNNRGKDTSQRTDCAASASGRLFRGASVKRWIWGTRRMRGAAHVVRRPGSLRPAVSCRIHRRRCTRYLDSPYRAVCYRQDETLPQACEGNRRSRHRHLMRIPLSSPIPRVLISAPRTRTPVSVTSLQSSMSTLISCRSAHDTDG